MLCYSIMEQHKIVDCFRTLENPESQQGLCQYKKAEPPKNNGQYDSDSRGYENA